MPSCDLRGTAVDGCALHQLNVVALQGIGGGGGGLSEFTCVDQALVHPLPAGMPCGSWLLDLQCRH